MNYVYSAQSVDAWVSYVRTRESILAKHYDSDSLILAGCVGEPRCRALLDTLLAGLEPLKLLPFSLDLMFEMRELHRSFKKIESDMRAASRVSQYVLATCKMTKIFHLPNTGVYLPTNYTQRLSMI